MSSADNRFPLVVACLRVVDQEPAVDPLTGAIRRDASAARASVADMAALEHALRIAEAWSGRVLAVALGSPAADSVLREAVAVGADALRIAWDGGSLMHSAAHPGPNATGDELLGGLPGYLADLASDTCAVARALAAAIRTIGEPSVIVCGDRSADRGTGELPARLAHEFGAAQALGLVRLEARNGHLIAERRLDRGGRERLRVPVPAVCSVEGAGVSLRRAGLRAALAAASAKVPSVDLDFATGLSGVSIGIPRPRRPRTRVLPAPTGAPRERLLALTGALADDDRPTVVGPLEAGEAAEQLLGYLRRYGYLDEPERGEP